LTNLNHPNLNSINTVQELIQQLSDCSKDNYNTVLQNLCIERRSFSKYEHWSKEKYLRNGIYKDERFEIILLCWEKGQETTVHCHGGEECWVYLLEGEIEEVFYIKDGNGNPIKVASKKLQVSKSSYINDTIGLHSMRNSFEGRSLSLHIYAKPIFECSFYDEDDHKFKMKTMVYDTFYDEYCGVPKA
jgi:cysteine dioxygenase